MFALLVLASPALGQLADSAWPVFHGDAMHTGLSPYDTSHLNGAASWAYEAGGAIESSPVIGADGTIYFGSHDGSFYAVTNHGELKWKIKIGTPIGKMAGYIESGGNDEGFKFDANTSIPSTAAIDKNGNIYVASRDQYLFAISQDGKENWKFPIGVAFDSWSSPVIGSDGTIYMASARPKGGLYAINPDGTEKWYYEIEMGASNSAAIGADGVIYVAFPTGYNKNALIAVNQDGTKKWEIPLMFYSESTPAIAGDTIYIGTFTEESTGAGLYAISIPERKIKWHLDLNTKEVMTTPAVSEDSSTIYVGSFEGVLYAITADGRIKWKLDTGNKEAGSSAAVSAEGTVYFGSGNGFLYALHPNGTEKWHYDTKSSVASSPAIGSDGTIYFGAWDKKLYAIGGNRNEVPVEKLDSGIQQKQADLGKGEPPKECIVDGEFIGEDKCRSLMDKAYAAQPGRAEPQERNFLQQIIYWFLSLFR